MKPYQERVIQEKKELDEKMDKLRNFINAGCPGVGSNDAEVKRLSRQMEYMFDYSRVLGERIAAFT